MRDPMRRLNETAHKTIQGADTMLHEMRVAVCGNLPTTRKALRELGVSQIDSYSDGIKLWFRLHGETPYHLVLIHSPAGAGMTDLHHSYKKTE